MAVFSTIQKSQLEGAKRLDAEYYQPEYLLLNEKLRKQKIKLLDELAFITDGIHASIDYDPDSNIRCFSAQAPKDNYFESVEQFMSEKQHNVNKRTALKIGDVLLSSVGTIGNAAVVDQSMLPANADRHVGIIRLHNNQLISPYFLSTFLNSKYGRFQSVRESTGNVQLNLFIDKIKTFVVPCPNVAQIQEVDKIAADAFQERGKAEDFYSQAEKVLLGKLGLEDFEAGGELWNVVNLSKVKKASRMDAEYFQPKFQDVIEKIEKYSIGWKFLEDLTTFINNGVQPPYSENGEVRFFSQKWIGDKSIDYSFLTADNEPRVSKSFFEEKKNKPYLVKKNDILYYSVGANLGYCHNYLESEDIAIGSFINLIRADATKIDPIFLGFCLNSVVGRMQAERDKSGLAQPYIYAKNLRKFKIPIVRKDTQQRIAELVRESHEAQKQAKQLLEEAKRKVEELIEKPAK
ncbi:MAG: restriction endonuclease subunit S [Candidatus Vogelbacteria bacterium]|nr:restriction endonuclease subunit S [Candidatus Vogelbacteria bacterium]